MAQLQRTSTLALAASTVSGLAIGLLTQFARSTWGYAPLAPPISLSATLLVIAIVLLVLGFLLRRAIAHRAGKRVDPFHAVRLLAGARAGALAGALFAGFGGGLALQLLTRSMPAASEIWVPILLVIGSGIVLLVCALIVEHFCRVPPTEGDAEADTEADPESDGTLAPGAP